VKLEFYSLAEGIDLAYPPIPISEVKMSWIKKSQDFFGEQIKRGSHDLNVAHLCSGIRNLISVGYAITAAHDIEIKTNGDGCTFDWFTPKTNMELLGIGDEGVGYFSKEVYGNHAVLPPQTLKTIIKIPSPWRVRMPKGWGLLMLPMHYADENRFSSLMGVLDTEITTSLNAVLYWHVLSGSTLIKAGTPLFYVIPVKLDEKLDVVIRVATEKERQWEKIRKTVKNATWKNGAQKVKSIYNKFWRLK
jgi:hypothetical protein